MTLPPNFFTWKFHADNPAYFFLAFWALIFTWAFFFGSNAR